MKDKYNREIASGSIVIVPKPTKRCKDAHKEAFKGMVVRFDGKDVVVEDYKSEFFLIKPKRLIVSN